MPADAAGPRPNISRTPDKMRACLPDMQGEKGGRWGRGHADCRGRQPLGIFLYGEGRIFPGAHRGRGGGGADVRCSSPRATGRSRAPSRRTWHAFGRTSRTCIICKNCKTMCPVCYCIDCLFNGDEYLPEGRRPSEQGPPHGLDGHAPGQRAVPSHPHVPRVPDVRRLRRVRGGMPAGHPSRRNTSRAYRRGSRTCSPTCRAASLDEAIPYLTFLEDELHDAED